MEEEANLDRPEKPNSDHDDVVQCILHYIMI